MVKKFFNWLTAGKWPKDTPPELIVDLAVILFVSIVVSTIIFKT